MRYQAFFATSMLLVLAGCGADSGDANGPVSAEEAAAIPQAGVAGNTDRTLIISPRTYTSGTVKAKVTGFFQVDGTQTLNKPASITDEDQTWIQYGVSGAQELNVLFTNSTAMAENGVTIGVGPYSVTVTSTSGECRTKFDVTPALVSGHYSCSGSTGYNNKTGKMGKVDVEVDFSAG
jgi:hypothetical protein